MAWAMPPASSCAFFTWAFTLTLPRTGKSSAARIAMMLMTTSSSTRVKARECGVRRAECEAARGRAGISVVLHKRCQWGYAFANEV